MKTIKYVSFILAMLIVNTGCVSHFAHKNWSEAQQRKAVRVEADGETVMVGLDLTAGEYFRDNWGIAIAAGLADAAIIYGGYRIVDGIINEVNGSSTTDGMFGDNNGNGRDNNDQDSSTINITVNQ
jgi:hypothetical protein